MLLREENYTKTFSSGGGAGSRVLDVGRAARAAQGLTDWMIKASPGSMGPASPASRRSSGSKDGQRSQLPLLKGGR